MRVDLSFLRPKDSVWENDLLIIRASHNKRPQSSELLHCITALLLFLYHGALPWGTTTEDNTHREYSNGVHPEFWNWLTALLSQSSLKLACFCAKFLTMESWLILIQSTYCRYADQIRPPYQFIVLASLIEFSISYNLQHLFLPFKKRFCLLVAETERNSASHLWKSKQMIIHGI